MTQTVHWNMELLLPIFQKEKRTDWWDELPEEIQESILKGIEDVRKGKTFTHKQVIQEARQKYGF